MNVGGVAALVGQLVEALPEHGVDAVLATGDVQEGEQEVDTLPLGTVRLPGLVRAPRPQDDLRALRALRRLIREVQPDVVHTHTAKAGVLGRLAAEGIGPARVHTFHGHLLRGYFTRPLTGAVTGAERLLALRTDLLISSGAVVGRELRAVGVGRSRPWANIPPGIQPPVLTGTTEPRTVAFLGRLVAVKRVDRLLHVARLLPDVTFLIAGDGPLRVTLTRQAPANVEFLGWTSDVGAVLGRAQIVALTSDNEAMPLALVEAAMSGLPAVTTDAGAAREVVQHGKTGMVVSSPEEMAEAIGLLLSDDRSRLAMGSAAAERALRRFSVRGMVEQHVSAYSQAKDRQR